MKINSKHTKIEYRMETPGRSSCYSATRKKKNKFNQGYF